MLRERQSLCIAKSINPCQPTLSTQADKVRKLCQKIVLEWVQNIMRKGEKYGCRFQAFSPFLRKGFFIWMVKIHDYVVKRIEEGDGCDAVCNSVYRYEIR